MVVVGGGEDTWLHRFGFSRESVEMALLAPRGTFNTLIHRTHTSAPPLLHLHHSQASAAGRRLFPYLLFAALVYFSNKLSFISFLFRLGKHGDAVFLVFWASESRLSAPPLVLRRSDRKLARAK